MTPQDHSQDRPSPLKSLRILGIETSCDDTAAGVIKREPNGNCQILSSVTATQFEDHAAFGGVVPEIAARSHVERLDGVIEAAMQEASMTFYDLDGIAATAGPGLVGGVMVGLTTAKAISMAHNLPLLPVNHLEGHALSAQMTEDIDFPYLLLLISGGHTQLILAKSLGSYQRLGTTIDDAAGEAFDKTAKLLGLGQPGGPKIEAAALNGDASRYDLPKPLAKREGCDFSLSGLKTAVRLIAEAIDHPTAADAANIAAAFQRAIAHHLGDRTRRAMHLANAQEGVTKLVVAGGVAANQSIRTTLEKITNSEGWTLFVPPPKYCTDNGAMIAWVGAQQLAHLGPLPMQDALAFAPKARWPLAPPPVGKEHGGGKKGPKA